MWCVCVLFTYTYDSKLLMNLVGVYNMHIYQHSCIISGSLFRHYIVFVEIVRKVIMLRIVAM